MMTDSMPKKESADANLFLKVLHLSPTFEAALNNYDYVTAKESIKTLQTDGLLSIDELEKMNAALAEIQAENEDGKPW